MKTAQDFLANVETYNAGIESKINNLIRMKEEYTKTAQTAQAIIVGLDSILKKLHLTIKEFTVSSPSEASAEAKKSISLTLAPLDKFRFLTFRGYDRHGNGKNHDRLRSKAQKLSDTMADRLVALELSSYIYVDVNEWSLEVKNEGDSKNVLMSIVFAI